MSKTKISISYKIYKLELRHVFRIAKGERKFTDTLLTKISFNGFDGYGEGAMPVLYGESEASALAFMKKVDLTRFETPFEIDAIMRYVDSLEEGNQAVKAAIDIALHDLVANILNIPVYYLLGLKATPKATSMTIGIDTASEMAKKALAYSDFKYLKIKLGSPNDAQIIKAIREVSQQPLFIDANQGWNCKEEALDRIYWLREHAAVFIEQPMDKFDLKSHTWLAERSPLPIVADESFQRLTDLNDVQHAFHGINIKLMKSTGISEGYKMAVSAKALGMKVMLGCMTESSCGISAAAQLVDLADWIDLDGNLDLLNDPYQGVKVVDGFLIPSSLPGIGLIH